MGKRFQKQQTPLLSSGDNLWFFFSGHGRRYQGQDYLLLSDSDPSPEHIKQTAISIDYVTERLCQSGAGNIILFIDACRDSAKGGVGLELTNQQGVISIASCSPNELSYEIDALQHGSFTYALVESLNIQGEGNCATVERLSHRLRTRVKEINKHYNKPIQTPHEVIQPASKYHLILLPSQATLQDVADLKIEAYKAEEKDLDLAEKLWTQVLVASPADLDALTRLKKIWVDDLTWQHKFQVQELEKSFSKEKQDIEELKSAEIQKLDQFYRNQRQELEQSLQSKIRYLQEELTLLEKQLPETRPYHLRPGTLIKQGSYKIIRTLTETHDYIPFIIYKIIRIANSQELVVRELWSENADRDKKNMIWPIRTSPTERQKTIDTFKQQFVYLKQCIHPNIIKVYELFEENNTVYEIRDFIKGNTLSHILKEEGSLPLQRAKRYIIQIAEILRVIHSRNLLHRDIKPENFLVNQQDQIVLIDFSCAKEFLVEKEVEHDVILTPEYAPVEQYTRQGIKSPSMDIYALCASMYEMVTGQLPPNAISRYPQDTLITPRQYNPQVDTLTEQVILTGMKMKPSDRFQSADELIDALNGKGAFP
jgi:serine/threonine protein kinase